MRRLQAAGHDAIVVQPEQLDHVPDVGLGLDPARRDWSRLSQKWSMRIDDRIAELERLKLGLTECIGCGCLSLDRCKLANPLDQAAALGPGPRYWMGDRRDRG